jgi:hypothetical protein
MDEFLLKDGVKIPHDTKENIGPLATLTCSRFGVDGRQPRLYLGKDSEYSASLRENGTPGDNREPRRYGVAKRRHERFGFVVTGLGSTVPAL